MPEHAADTSPATCFPACVRPPQNNPPTFTYSNYSHNYNLVRIVYTRPAPHACGAEDAGVHGHRSGNLAGVVRDPVAKTLGRP